MTGNCHSPDETVAIWLDRLDHSVFGKRGRDPLERRAPAQRSTIGTLNR
ncbi:MAG: hypothetical protein OXG33_06460 [Chloroflexi bacterium]|nr:hypothetical protein [Chloroflexota bacterium]